jgi:hypothetical protein
MVYLFRSPYSLSCAVISLTMVVGANGTGRVDHILNAIAGLGGEPKLLVERTTPVVCTSHARQRQDHDG